MPTDLRTTWPTRVVRYRGFAIVPLVDDVTGAVWAWDVHAPEDGDDFANAIEVDTVPTIAAGRRVVRDEVSWRRMNTVLGSIGPLSHDE